MRMTSRLTLKKYLLFFIVLMICEMSTPVHGIAPQSTPKMTSGSKALFTADSVAFVNEKMISIIDLKNRAKFFAIISGQPYSKSFFEKVAPQLLETMINESLQRQQASFYKIKIGKEEIKDSITQMEKMNEKPEGFLKKLLKDHKIPYEILEKQMEASLSWDIISREMFRASLQVSKNEIDSHIQRLEANRDRPHHHLAEIFVSVDGPEQDRKGRKKSHEIMSYLRKGARFSVLAQQFSDSPTKTHGGDIGWIPKGELDASLNDVVAQLKPHEYSQPIRTQDGYMILYLIDAKETSPEMAAQTIYTHKRINFPLSVSASESKIMKVFSKADSVSQNAKSCEMLVKLAKSVAAEAQIKEVGGVRAEDLPSPVLNILTKLTPCMEGVQPRKCRASTPVRSEIGVLVFMVCKKETIPAGEINRNQVENVISNQKLQKLMGREMRNLRRASYIVNKFDSSGNSVIAQK